MDVLTVVVCDDIGNINLAICGFRPHAFAQDAGSDASQGAMMRHDEWAVWVTVCRDRRRNEMTVHDVYSMTTPLLCANCSQTVASDCTFKSLLAEPLQFTAHTQALHVVTPIINSCVTDIIRTTKAQPSHD